MPIINQDRLKNKLLGMFHLGAYGDIIGAPREKEAIDDGKYFFAEHATIGKLLGLHHYKRITEYIPDKWAIWANKDVIENMIGIPTDDTAFRFLILHRWILDTHEHQLSEYNFRQWLEANSTLPRFYDTGGISQSYKEIIEQFQSFYRVKEGTATPTERENSFFQSDRPVFFGNFMFLELTAIYLNESIDHILETFYNFSILDIFHGRTTTALTAALLYRCFHRGNIELNQVYDFLLENMRELLEKSKSNNYLEVDKIEAAIYWGIQQAETANTVEELFETFKSHYDNKGKNGNYGHSPLWMWKQIWAGLTFYKGKPLEAFTFTAICVGDTDTVSSFLGTLLGALLGEENLRNATINEYELNPIFDEIDTNLQILFKTNLEDSAAIFIDSYSDRIA